MSQWTTLAYLDTAIVLGAGAVHLGKNRQVPSIRNDSLKTETCKAIFPDRGLHKMGDGGVSLRSHGLATYGLRLSRSAGMRIVETNSHELGQHYIVMHRVWSQCATVPQAAVGSRRLGARNDAGGREVPKVHGREAHPLDVVIDIGGLKL